MTPARVASPCCAEEHLQSFFLCPRACINQHLMNNKDCFFCKATITGVDDFTKPASS